MKKPCTESSPLFLELRRTKRKGVFGGGFDILLQHMIKRQLGECQHGGTKKAIRDAIGGGKKGEGEGERGGGGVRVGEGPGTPGSHGGGRDQESGGREREQKRQSF